MKEIGETLKEARESIGVSVEEVASDLKVRPNQIQNIEDGNMKAFKDVLYVKGLVKEYSKYLGLDYDSMIDLMSICLIILLKYHCQIFKKLKKRLKRKKIKGKKLYLLIH